MLPYNAQDPRIGMVVRNGTTVFYAYVGGRLVEHTDPLEVAAHLWAADKSAT